MNVFNAFCVTGIAWVNFEEGFKKCYCLWITSYGLDGVNIISKGGSLGFSSYLCSFGYLLGYLIVIFCQWGRSDIFPLCRVLSSWWYLIFWSRSSLLVTSVTNWFGIARFNFAKLSFFFWCERTYNNVS